MGYTPGQLDAVSRYLGLPGGYAPAGIPPVTPTVTMPVVEMGPTPAAPMPVVVPPPGATAPMPVVNPDAAALSRQLGLAPPVSMPVASPSSPIAPQSVGLQLPPGIAPAGTVPVPAMAPPPPLPAAVPPPAPPPPAPVAGPPPAPPPPPHQAAAPKPAAPREPSWADKRRADEAAYLATFGAERTAAREANDASLVVRDENAQATARLARQQEELAANEAAFQRDEAEARATYRAQTQRQVDEVREMKVDPGRYYRDANSWTGVLTAVGGALAGALSGFQGRGDNAFVDIINKNIDRDINAQVQAIGQKNASIADRNSLYGQLVASHKDETLARAQTRMAMLESARTHAESEAQRLGTVEAQKRFEVLDTQLARTQEQAKAAVDGAEEQAAIRKAQAEAQARAAWAAAQAAERRQRFKDGLELEDRRLKEKQIDLEHGDGSSKPNSKNATFVAVGKDEKGNPIGFHARDVETAKKRTEDLKNGRALLKMYDQIINNREQEGKLGRVTSRGEGSFLGTPKWKTDNAVVAKKILLTEKNIDQLGALSGSDMELESLGDVNANDALGDTTTDRLKMRRKLVEENLKLAEQGEAGSRSRKVVGADGRPTFVPLEGPANAPNNPKTVQRNPLK